MKTRMFVSMIVGLVALATIAMADDKKEKPDKEKGQRQKQEKKEGPTIPDGLKGFSGQLEGTVTERQDNGRGFRLKVASIGQRWKGDKSIKPESAVGKTLLVNAQWQKGDDGNSRPSAAHVGFIKSLEADESITIEVVNDEGERLHILELNAEQRKRGQSDASD